jgi:CheY-like chemotaxis protein
VSLKILLADDSMTAQNMGKKILADAGYDVVAVSNGAQAVKKMAEHKPDIAILDIYMPGYTGLEVCERVKSTLESAKTPVLLTVGKMEPYRPEDGSRVHADGVIVKPFEASDLLAVVEKLAGRIASSSKPKAAYEETMVIPPPTEADFADFKDGSSKQSAQDAGENTGPDRVEVPQEMQVTPAMGFEEFGVEPVHSEVASSVESDPLPQLAAAAVASFEPDGFAPITSFDSLTEPASQPVEFSSALEPADTDEPFFSVEPDSLLETAPSLELPAADTPLVQPFEVEFTSAPSLDSIDVQAAPELEALETSADIAITSSTDPALAAPTDLVSEFTTNFGTADNDQVVVGIVPELLETGSTNVHSTEASEASASSSDDFEARVAAAMASYSDSSIHPSFSQQSDEQKPETVSEWKAEEAPIEADEANISLEQEMAMFATPEIAKVVEPEFIAEPVEVEEAETAVLPEPTVEITDAVTSVEESAVPEPATVIEEPVVESYEPPSQTGVQDLELAAAMAAAISNKPAEPELAVPATASIGEAVAATAVSDAHAAKLDESRIAHALQRVLERFKPQLVAEIARELASDEEDSRK